MGPFTLVIVIVFFVSVVVVVAAAALQYVAFVGVVVAFVIVLTMGAAAIVHFVAVVQAIYKDRRFIVEDAEQTSGWHPQAFGIRHGVPHCHRSYS